ncbi:MAG: polyprenyl synthetase family protein [Aestuariivirga sp.]
MTFAERLAVVQQMVQQRLDRRMTDMGDEPVVQAMSYAVTGGKRLRAFLVMEGAALHGIADRDSVDAAAAIEAMHAYSLVHDDLPCMDDDDVRRGQPTVHVKWNEATAVLAGDALQALAFDLLTHPSSVPHVAQLALVAGMAHAAGAMGMVLGQALDISAEKAATPLTLAEIERLQRGKTGALINWAATAGPVMALADPTPMRRYATALGLAFQIADDILDVTGDEAKTGKRLQKDAEAGKATFVSLLGLEGAKARAAALVEEAEAAVEGYGEGAANLKAAARFVIARDN